MLQIALVTHLYLVISLPSNYIELTPVLCSLPSAGLRESWAQAACSVQAPSSSVERLVTVRLCPLLSLACLVSRLVLLSWVTASMAKWLQEGKNEADVPVCSGFAPLTSCIKLSLLRWQRFHWDAWEKSSHLQSVTLPPEFSSNYSMCRAWGH